MSQENIQNIQDSDERRQISRLHIEVKFKYKFTGASADKAIMQDAVTKNISASGLLFESKEIIPLDTELNMVLDMPGFPHKSIEAYGKVARIERILFGAGFDIGVTFLNLAADSKEEIELRIDRMDIINLLEKVNRKEISDLHLTANSPPMIRHYGELMPLDDNPLSEEQIKQMIYSILNDEQKKRFESDKDLDFAFSPGSELRYRVSMYQQRGKAEVVFRNILPRIKSREELGLPDVIEDLCNIREGIVIIGGTTGSGKTTTITTMIDIINKTRGGVILSLEKPIEYLHTNVKGIVKQREVGVDVPTFARGLKAALRQDPDVIVVGEMLDSDSVETALEASETGHLVITSFHATDAVQVFDRLITFFPLEQRHFIYARLSHCLKAIIIQSLLPHKSGIGRVIATEVCVVNMAVKRIIHTGDFTQLPSVMQTGSKYKMHLMHNSIDRLFEQGLITAEIYEIYKKEQGK